MKLTILFDPPYWIGLLEDERDGYWYAARHIFGAEPSDPDVYAFVQRDLIPLYQSMTVGVPVETGSQKTVNPKRMQREVRRELAQPGITTKAHEAMRLQLEQNKGARQRESRQQREAEREHKRVMAEAKAKARRKGH